MKTSLLFLIVAVFVGIAVNIGYAATPMHGSISISNTTLHANQPEQITYTVSGGVPPYNYILYFSNSTSTFNLKYTSEVSPVVYFNFTAHSYISQNSVFEILFAANDSEVPNETTGNVIGGYITEVANPPPNVIYSLTPNNNAGLSASTWIQSIYPASISSSGYTYPMGTNVTINPSLCIVSCSYGYIFSNWTGTGSGSYTGTQAFFSTITMNSNIIETANYRYLNATISTKVSNTIPVTLSSNFYNGQTINLGQSVILYANASGGDGNYAYTWYTYNLGTDQLGQAVGQGTSFTVSPTAIGDYAYCAIAREDTSGIKTNPYTCLFPVEITVVPSGATIVAISSNKTSAYANEKIKLTATVTNPTGNYIYIWENYSGQIGQTTTPTFVTQIMPEGGNANFLYSVQLENASDPTNPKWYVMSQVPVSVGILLPYLLVQTPTDLHNGGTVTVVGGMYCPTPGCTSDHVTDIASQYTGTDIQITANPANGYIFKGWQCTGYDCYSGLQETYNFMLIGNVTETATFVATNSVTPTTTTTIIPSTTTTITPTSTTTAISSNIVFNKVTINIQPGWNLLSIPVSESDNWDYTFKSFSNNCGATLGMNSNNDFNISGNLLWGYENPSNSYVSLSAETDLFNFLRTGSVTGTGNIGYFGVLGFWFNSPKQCSISTFAISGGQYTTKLFEGWNVIGATEITSASFNSIASSCNLRGGFYAYNAITNSYSAVATPTPGAGYFVYANAPCTLDWNAGASSSGSSSPPSVPK